MATLHVDLAFGLSVEHTRNFLGQYSRGCDLPSFCRYMPKVSINAQDEQYFDTTESKTICFLSDFFGATPPFDVQLLLSDGQHVLHTDCNMLLVEASNIVGIKIYNKSQENQRFHMIL